MKSETKGQNTEEIVALKSKMYGYSYLSIVDDTILKRKEPLKRFVENKKAKGVKKQLVEEFMILKD